ncbi:MAG: stage II sporulation protein D [Clostridia bacterium]|nr:stage II sporulation protein D [Clostridia bacterium]
MKKYLLCHFICLLLIFIIPLTVILASNIATGINVSEYKPTLSLKSITVYNSKTDKVMEMDLEEYLCGVISAEMPASFPYEALKAQAVAARTYIVKRCENSTSTDAHKGAMMCTSSAHCNAWFSKEERMEKWEKSEAQSNWNKIVSAVNDTSGEIMTYDGAPITAVFYAISSGKTENAEDVWGGNVPYLQSAESPYDTQAPGYSSTATFSKEEFKNIILSAGKGADLSDSPSTWYKNENRSEGGAVLDCNIGGAVFKGTEIRSLFSLRSHNYTLSYDDGSFTFNVKGYGHGVGMSQWGAKYYAEEGKSYKDILKIYYSGISFRKI